MVGVVIKIGVQFSGIDAIFYYSTLMFRHANVADPQLSTFLLSLVNVAMTFIALTIMDKAGRRPLLMCTWVGMCCGFGTIYVTSTLGDVFGFFPTLMSSAQASPSPSPSQSPEPRAPSPSLEPEPRARAPSPSPDEPEPERSPSPSPSPSPAARLWRWC